MENNITTTVATVANLQEAAFRIIRGACGEDAALPNDKQLSEDIAACINRKLGGAE